MFDITQNFIPNIPRIAYADGVGNYRGVCAHATANYGGSNGDLAVNERNWEVQNWQSAFVHYFVDHATILQTAPVEYVSWGCGGGNKFYASVELCQVVNDGSSDKKEKFDQSYSRYVYLLAKILFDRKLGVIDGETLCSHAQITAKFGGTHQDPIEYLKTWGIEWSDVVNDVTYCYSQLVDWSKPKEVEIEKVDATVNQILFLANTYQDDKNEGTKAWAYSELLKYRKEG